MWVAGGGYWDVGGGSDMSHMMLHGAYDTRYLIFNTDYHTYDSKKNTFIEILGNIKLRIPSTFIKL